MESIIGLLKKFKNSGSREDWKKGKARWRKRGAKEEEGRGKGGGKEDNGEGKEEDAREELRVKGGKERLGKGGGRRKVY